VRSLPGLAHAINTHARFAYLGRKTAGVVDQRRPGAGIGYFRGTAILRGHGGDVTITPR